MLRIFRNSFWAFVALAAVSIAAAAQTQPSPKPTAKTQIIAGPSIIELDTNGGYLGVYLEEVTPDRMKDLGLTQERGAIVMSVVKGSPADKAGLKENDVITSFNGHQVDSVRQLQRMLRETPSGRTVSVEVMRNGKSHTYNATLEKEDFSAISREMAQSYGRFGEGLRALPEMPPYNFNFNFDADGNFFGRPRLGVSAEPLTRQLASFFGAKDGGVLISEVTEKSPAAAAGLKAGDVIVEFDNQKINSVADLRAALAKKSEGSVSVKIIRDHAEKTLTVELKASMRQIRFLRVPHPFVFANLAV